MGVYKTFINKKRKPIEKKSYTMQVAEHLDACEKIQETFAASPEKPKLISIIKKHEAMAKVKGYEACRSGVDIPLTHKMIREIEQIRVALTKNPI